MSLLRKASADLSFEGAVLFDEPMANHTSYQVGGPAELYLIPQSEGDIIGAISLAALSESSIFVLGAGANILVSDSGIPGIVLDMGCFDACRITGEGIVCGAGLNITDASQAAADNGFTGMEFIYSMPGSVGGSVCMNARCYGRSVSDILECVEIIDSSGDTKLEYPSLDMFGYKRSPYQRQFCVITQVSFRLRPGDPARISASMRDYRDDREKKGHFAAPSAGSVFKNNRDFGRPSGKIIDSLGLRGERIGGAMISKVHANIIVNTGGSTAMDILRLITLIEGRVYQGFGHVLEREVILVGEWDQGSLKAAAPSK
ncbi:MAG: UDP-N-acetylenolpyruvoylglucosamine reductase [Spirochaetales bacterium]|nr:UDP-N-acetylenolpyruvoylglucosamine reductase [Spirochaetales bacterium]